MITLNDIVKNEHAKRALEVALAGEHSIQFVGPWTSDADLLTQWAREHGLKARHATPCPCGHFGSKDRECTCSLSMVAKHQRQKFGPREQWDITIEVYIPYSDDIVSWLNGGRKGEPDDAVLDRVTASSDYADTCLDSAGQMLLKAAITQLGLAPMQARAVIAIARTAANLARSEKIGACHLAEAIQYRPRRNGY